MTRAVRRTVSGVAEEMTTLAFDGQITFLPTADLTACAHFYETVMLLPLAVDQGSIRIYQVATGGFLGFCQSDDPAPNDERIILTFVCDDVDGWHARLRTQGIATDGTPRVNEKYQIYHFFAHDPDGYRIEVQRFLHPFPQTTGLAEATEEDET